MRRPSSLIRVFRDDRDEINNRAREKGVSAATIVHEALHSPKPAYHALELEYRKLQEKVKALEKERDDEKAPCEGSSHSSI